ncbi:Histidine--tRNA ligase [Pontiella desulfatans]|uniref:Histidine--tRNA ligase n=1 Tax=Pontiella desulfatans TaxID=2750659 RepID=A0A6C2UB78_PONDE|nr:histidine--tRNA ligase [Pontiella desulfatans]VGO16614.1 Histidine--tRNA ligase [Pontiella desulfatans]
MASNEFQPLQGMSDIQAPEIYLWRMMEERARSVFNSYGYEELRTPVLEKLSVYQRSLGDTTDVVKKEMYSFKPSKHELAMRPEGTAGTIRHLAGRGEEGLGARVFYIAPMFRYERPQAGRKRQFHQLGVEATGEPNPLADAECIALQKALLDSWGLTGSKIQVSTRGEPSDRKPVADGLRDALRPFEKELCEDCQRRIDENVLRVIDCKNENCQKIVDQIPSAIEFMSDSSRNYLKQVVDALAAMGIEVVVNPKLIRGLDYYVHTVWEISHSALGAQDALAGGGRYEIALGKKAIPGVGFAVGFERAIMALEACGITGEQFAPACGIWLVSLGEAALVENMKLAAGLRAKGVRCGMELAAKSMKAQMRKADRSGAEKVIIRGEDEIAKGIVVVKDMAEGTQVEQSLEDVLRTA